MTISIEFEGIQRRAWLAKCRGIIIQIINNFTSALKLRADLIILFERIESKDTINPENGIFFVSQRM